MIGGRQLPVNPELDSVQHCGEGSSHKCRKKPKKSAEKPLQASVTIIPGDAPTFYVNHLEIGHTANDFSALAVRIPAKWPPDRIAEAKETGAIAVEADVQLVFPPTVINGLIRALTTQKQKFEEDTGALLPDAKSGDS